MENNTVLLLNPNWRNMKDDKGRIGLSDPCYPLELLYISDMLEQGGIKSKVIDLWAINLGIEDVSEDINNASIIIITTAPTYLFWRDGIVGIDFPLEIIKQIRSINSYATLVIIGPQGTITPDSFYDSEVEFVIRGEPDLICPELIKRIVNHGNGYEVLPGICYKKDSYWITSNIFACVENLDVLPDLKYKKINLADYKYRKHSIASKDSHFGTYEASRGCVFNCIFCFRKGFRGSHRVKSIRKVGKELQSLIINGVKDIFFIDETFGLHNDWTLELCKELRRMKIRWSCQTRAEVLNKAKIEAMASAGCVDVSIGLESASLKIMENINKKQDLVKFKENLLEMTKAGISTTLFCILGSPGETKNTIRETLDFIMQFESTLIRANGHIMIPYPGTELWEIGRKEGKLKDWKDIKRYAGGIGNDFNRLSDIENECKRFNLIVEHLKPIRDRYAELKQRNMLNYQDFSNLKISNIIIDFLKLAFYGIFKNIPIANFLLRCAKSLNFKEFPSGYFRFFIPHL